MNIVTRNEVLAKLRRRYQSAGAEHKGKLLPQAVQLLATIAKRGSSKRPHPLEESLALFHISASFSMKKNTGSVNFRSAWQCQVRGGRARARKFGLLSLLSLLTLGARGWAHPLDPLSTNEVEIVTQALRDSGRVQPADLFATMGLREPSKTEVLAWKPGNPSRREAYAVVLKRQLNQTFEGLVDLATRRVVGWEQIPGVQPPWTASEDAEATALIRTNSLWQTAMRKRGITDFPNVAIATWMPGHYPVGAQRGGRYFRTAFYYQGSGTNYYGPPIEGIEAVVDMNRMQVVEVNDTGPKAIAGESTDFFNAQVRGGPRPALKSLTTVQSQGPSFTAEDNEIRWDRWRFRYSFNAREGLVLHLVRFQDGARERSVLYRASISELLVPYGDPGRNWFWRNAMDEGEYGLGASAAPLRRGQNTPAHATLFEVAMPNDHGLAEIWPDRIDLFERDGGILWSHFDYIAQVTAARRSRELLIGFIATVGNYDYAFHWIFRQDGSIEFIADLTGIILTKGTDLSQCEFCRQRPARPGTREPTGDEQFGTLVAAHTLGINHQHFVSMRLDFDVDGVSNSVKEINVNAVRSGRKEEAGGPFAARQTIFGREREASRDINIVSHRTWAVFNPNASTALGHYPAYELEPGANPVPFLPSGNIVRKFAGFADHHFFATRFHPEELYAGGPYPSHSARPNNLQTWLKDNESIDNQDVVVWHTFGLTHIPRPEDYPVMPAAHAGFKILPKGFFDRNPALDIPEPEALPDADSH